MSESKRVKAKRHAGPFILLVFLALVAVFPLLYTVTNSFMSTAEISRYYGQIAQQGGHTLFHLLPDIPSLDGYYQILLRRPDYLVKFWNSILLSGCIVAGQVVISCLAGYAFSRFRFPGKETVFFVLIILMMMPYQVTLVSNYIVLDKMKLIGTYASVILPAVFSPFGVFLMRQVFDNIPKALIEAAQLDGAHQVQILTRIAVPMSRSGIAALVILSFIDSWNMVEQPLIFLKSRLSYPLSIFLVQINSSNLQLGFACGVLAMLPAALLFLLFESELVEGISIASLK